MFADKVHVIKQRAHTVSYREVLHDTRTRHYIIGFQSVAQARKVQYSLAPEPSLYLQRTDFEDVTPQINEGLTKFGVASLDASIIIDTRARLHIPKGDAKLPSDHPLNDGNFHLSSIPMEEFLMFPFEKDIGIIIPYDLEKEDDNEFVFVSQVVEGSASTSIFRQRLDRDY